MNFLPGIIRSSCRSRSRSRCRKRRSESKTRCRSKRGAVPVHKIRPGRMTKNPFLNFLRVYRKKCTGKSVTQVALEAGKIWRNMTKAEKAPYFQQACAARKLYRRSACCPCPCPKRKRRRRCRSKRRRRRCKPRCSSSEEN